MSAGGLDLEVLHLAPYSLIRNERVALASEKYKYKIAFDGPHEEAPVTVKCRFIWRELSRSRPNVVIIHGNYALECWAAWLWSRLNNCPVIFWFESNEFDLRRTWWKEALKRWFISKCKFANTYGTSSTEYLRKLGMPAEKIHIKGAVVDSDKFSRVFRRRKFEDAPGTRILFVGRLAPEKNLLFLLDAMAEVRDADCHAPLSLTVAGCGPMELALKKRSSDRQLNSSVSFLGYVRQELLPELMLLHDALVLPSTYEPWGLVAAEAMLTGMPVLVSSNCGCARDLITPETGWEFSPSSRPELAAALRTLMDRKPSQLQSMATAAHRLALRYNPAAVADVVISSVLTAHDESRRHPQPNHR